MNPRQFLFLPGLLLLVVSLACAQPALPTSFVVPYVVDSGINVNVGVQAQVVYRHEVHHPGAPALRIFFSVLDLGPGDYLEVSAPGAPETHRIDRLEAAKWNLSSAYFNGDTLLLELHLRPGSLGRFVTSRIDVGTAPYGTDTICGSTDDRVPIVDNRVCRIVSSGTATGGGCTGWLASIDDCGITAGHCVSCCTGVAEFNVPLSTPSGSIQHPPVSDQFPIDQTSVQFVNGGLGNDWAVFKILPNILGQSPAQLYGWFTVGNFIPNAGETIRITGFGSGGGQLSQTNRTHTGPYVTTTGTRVAYQVDTTGGNSGSPVIHESTGMAIGVHTNGGCSSSGGANSGTSYTNSFFNSVHQAICALSSFFFDLSTTGSGTGDLHMSLLNVPAGMVEGYTLFSFNLAGPVGQGPLVGLYPDLTTFEILLQPSSSTNILHFSSPLSQGFWPFQPLDFPAGSVPFAPGTSVDGVVVALGPNYAFLGATNTVRITF